MFKANGVYELPFGAGHRLHYRPLDRVIGGWTLSAIMSWSSGAPFSILSGRGTLNRSLQGVYGLGTSLTDTSSRSYYNTATTSLTMSQLNNIVNFRMTGNGPYMISQSAIDPADGTGVNGDGNPSFSGQVFSNPPAGTVGVLQRRLFSGPWVFGLDMSALKAVKINEQQTLELRMDAFNAPNHVSFWAGGQNINDTNFGVVASDFGSRVVQF